jgi:hypothetical protein
VNTAGTQNTSGNADTATALETARTIGGESFDGTANIDLPGVNTVGTQNTSGNADTATTATNQSGGTVSATTGTFSGNVGIGTNNPRWGFEATPTSGLGGVLSCSDSPIFSHNLYYSGGWKYGTASTGGAYMRMIDSEIQFWNAPNSGSGTWDTAGGTATTTQRMTIDESGKVGIGTASPTEILHLAAGTNPQILVEDTGGANRSEIRFKTATTDWCLGQHGGDTGKFKIANDTTVGSGSLVTIDQSGNVGIGTASPDLELHVHDANNSTSGIILSSTSGYHRFYEASGQLYFQSGTAASADSRADINFTSMYASTTYMKILGSNGNVGIGLTSPAFPLDVDGVSRSRGVCVNSGFGNNTARPALTTGSTHPSYEIRSIGGNGNVGSAGGDDGFLRLRAGGGTGTNSASYIDLSGYSTYSGGDMKRNIVFGTFGTERMRIKENGNVGIGETSPSYKLDVNGEVRTGNILYIGKNTNDETAKTILFGGTYGDNGYDHCVIERRVWSTGTEKQELLLFSGNDGENNSGPDRIRLKGAQILFDTLNSSTDRTTENTKMIIRANGNVGIGTTSPGAKLDVNGDINSDGLLKIYGLNTRRLLIGYQRYESTTRAMYPHSTSSWQNSWNVTYTRKRAGSKIYIVSDLCLAQAMGSTNSVSYRGILGRAKVNDGVTDRYSDTVEDWQRIDNSFHEYQRQSRIHFGPDNLPGGNTITITMQVSHGGGSGSRSNWGINVWGGRSYIEVFESMEL